MRRVTLVTMGSPGLRAGKSPAFLVLARAGPVRAVADEEAGHEDLRQERGEREVCLVRGGKPRPCRPRLAGRAGS